MWKTEYIPTTITVEDSSSDLVSVNSYKCQDLSAVLGFYYTRWIFRLGLSECAFQWNVFYMSMMYLNYLSMSIKIQVMFLT